MHQMPELIFPVAAVREVDRCAIEDEGIPGYTLMTRAGEAAVSAARRRFPDARRWQVVCGAGNNAGDGYVVARLAADAGIDIRVAAMVDPALLKGDALTAYQDFSAGGGKATAFDGQLDRAADLVIDALLGSGLEREVAGDFAAAVTAINAHPGAVVALDIPTGLHGDSGAILGVAVDADLTVTFVGLKAGLFLRHGPDVCGDLEFAGLDIPSNCYRPSAAVLKRTAEACFRAWLPRRPRDSHKGDYGHVLVVGGGAGMPGAVRLAGEAALRSGAGRVSIATDPGHAAMIVATRPELMSHAITEESALRALLERVDVVAFGPGLGQSDWAKSLYRVVDDTELPSVWDADALNLLAAAGGRNDKRVITPHPGEAATLLGRSTADVQLDRLQALSDLQQKYAGTVVLKGAGTLVSSHEGPPTICTAGNPGMAAPGMGDALTGIIAAMLAQGFDPDQAACAGVEAHARAGDLAARGGERGLLATELMAELRGVLNP